MWFVQIGDVVVTGRVGLVCMCVYVTVNGLHFELVGGKKSLDVVWHHLFVSQICFRCVGSKSEAPLVAIQI